MNWKGGELKLRQLFRAARVASASSSVEPMPEHLKSRILARWRAGDQHDHSFLLALFRRALIGAAFVMLVCIIWSFDGFVDPPENDIALANYQLREHLLP